MVLDANKPERSDLPDEAAFQLSRESSDLARRRAKLPIAGAGQPWTACAAPGSLLVLGADGAVAACEYGPCRAAGGGDLLGAFASDAHARLRRRLEAGQLPWTHCRGCADWLQDDLVAPPLRDYGLLPAVPAPGPTTIVVRLAGDAAALPAAQAERLGPAVLAGLQTLVVECGAGSGTAGQLTALIGLLPPTEKPPELVVRLRDAGDLEAIRTALAGRRVRAVEFLAAVRDDAAFAAIRAFASALGAAATVRFVFTPENWFWFEEVARGCAEHGLPVDLRVLDRGGAAPLGELRVEDLKLVKDVVISSWSRCGTAERPKSIGDHAFDAVLAELRALLRRNAEAATRGVVPDRVAVLYLPKPGHAWTQDPARQAWWIGHLFGHGELPAVRAWLSRVVVGAEGDATVRRETWLRLLCQRLASDQRIPELLELLRRVYAEPKARKKLADADSAFAASFDLQPFGGPWAERLGLLAGAPRKRPFAIGKPKLPKPDAPPPDVTVLIPSYRHAEYIEETLQSVLAQKYTNFRVLVVDDGSPDDTVARARAVVDPRIEVRQNAANLGLGNSVLQALATIETPFVALLNSDDLFHPDRLARCRDVLLGQPDVQLVTTGMSLVDSRGGELTPANASLVLDGKLVYDWVHWFARVTPPADLPQDRLFPALLERNFLATSSNLVCRTEWLRAQAQALQSLKYCLDWQLFLQAALEGALRHLHEPLVAYRLHATNTVWFREGRRWSYYLEVNRVAADAMRRFAKRGRGEAAVVRLLEAIAAHLEANRETDGFALFLNTAFGALQVEQLAATSPRVQELVQKLNAFAEQVRAARDFAAEYQRDSAAGETDHSRLLGELAKEQARNERDTRRWLQGYADSLEGRLEECWAGRSKLEQAANGLRERERDLQRQLAEGTAELRRVTEQRDTLRRDEQALRQGSLAAETAAREANHRAEALRAEVAPLRQDLERLRGELAAVRELRTLIDGELAAVRAERDALRQRLEGAQAEREQLLKTTQELASGIARDREQLDQERARTAELRAARDHLAAELTAELSIVRGEVSRLKVERDDVERSRHDLHVEHEALHQEHVDLQRARDDLVKDRDALRQEGLQLRADRQQLAARGAELDQALERERAEAGRLREQGSRLGDELQAARSELDSMRSELHALQQRRDELDQQRQALDAALALEKTQARSLAEAKEGLDKRRIELRREVDGLRQELEKLRASREFRSGNFLWNKMPLGYMSRRGKKWYRRLLDAKSRCAMWGANLFGRRRKAEGTAIVTACWQWPIYSHTFVYQEMIGLTHMGLDVKLFHWDLGDTAQLHKAFGYLADHRTQLQPIWENHQKDKAHFEKTKPGRLRAFLEIVAKRMGRKVEELENDPIVMQGCTFARMAELAGARYLHSYFFYDQSFMAMQAAWLLGIPRGVSCYADHMLNDYPFKLVPLHVELCDVIVATSARIKRELSAMTDGKFDDKIIVKPNGVDGARFPPVQRQDRKPGDPFEVISISRIEPKKGLTHLVEAVAALKKQGHRVVAHIVGSKDPHSKGSLEYAAEFEQRIADLGVKDEVILHGMKRQEELPPILQRCRAFVAPYVEMGSGDKDGIPTAMLEGLASGLPVVTTDSGSILEVVTTEVEGIVVPQRDSAAFAKALQRLIEDPALERRMAKAARARFDREFDIRVTEKRLHERVAKLVGAQTAKKPGAK